MLQPQRRVQHRSCARGRSQRVQRTGVREAAQQVPGRPHQPLHHLIGLLPLGYRRSALGGKAVFVIMTPELGLVLPCVFEGQRFRYTYYDESQGEIYRSIENLDKMVNPPRRRLTLDLHTHGCRG